MAAPRASLAFRRGGGNPSARVRRPAPEPIPWRCWRSGGMCR